MPQSAIRNPQSIIRNPQSIRLPLTAALALVWAGALGAALVAQETPMASMRGQLVLKSGRPAPKLTVWITGPEVRKRVTADAEGRFDTGPIPTGEYRMEVSGEVLDGKLEKLRLEEGDQVETSLELNQKEPFLDVRLPQKVYRPGETVKLGLRSFVQSPTLEMVVAQVDIDRLFKTNAQLADRILHPEWNRLDEQQVRDLLLPQRRSETVTVAARDHEGLADQYVQVEVEGPGLYYLTLVGDAGEVVRHAGFLITDLAVVTKHAGDQLLAFVTNLQDGRPRAGATVSVHGAQGQSGTTRADGTLAFNLSSDASGDGSNVMVLARQGDELAWLDTYSYASDRLKPYRVHFYTDRPVYRPGHTVHFKGIVRKHSLGNYRVAAALPVELEVRDEKDTVVYKDTLSTNPRGSFQGSFTLLPEAQVGNYQAELTIAGEEYSQTIQVAAYRKPEYQIKIRTPQPRYTMGATIPVQVEAKYYFGAPVADAEVQYTVYRSPYWYYPDDDELSDSALYGSQWEEMDGGDEEGGYSGEPVAEGTTRTNSGGNAEFSFEAKRDEEEPDFWTDDARYTISVDLTDQGGKYYTAEGGVTVTAGEFRLEAGVDRYLLRLKQSANALITASDYEGKPVVNQTVTIQAERKEWVRRRNHWTEITTRRLRLARKRSDAKGQVRASFQAPQTGTWEIVASARDRQGNQVRDRNYLYVVDEKETDVGYVERPFKDMELVLDREVYQPGDTAEVMIQAQHPEAHVLVSVEGDSLYRSWTVEVKGSSTLTRIPIEAGYVPNVFVSVCYIKDKRLVQASRVLKVTSRKRLGKVVVTPDREEYRPGDQAKFAVQTTDAEGRPLPAEVSLAVVDESIFAIRADHPEEVIRTFYGIRYNSVETRYSFPEYYLQADKEPSETVRRDFPDTALWAPALMTDEQGRASVSMKMPDSLTTWRATAVMHTPDTMVGYGLGKTLCTQPFLCRLILPRFYTQRDRGEVRTVLHNNTHHPLRASASLTARGVKIDGAVESGASAVAEVEIEPNGSQTVKWTIEVPDLPDDRKAVFTVRATGQAIEGSKPESWRDAMELTVPVHPRGIEEVVAESGLVEGSKELNLTMPEGAVPNASSLEIRLSPSVASTMLGSLEYLTGYPYG